MNPRQARAGINPITSAVAQGYGGSQKLVSSVLFPVVRVEARGGTILTFGKDSFKILNTKRAPGSNTKVLEVGFGDDKFSLTDRRLQGLVAVEIAEEAMAVPGIDMASIAIETVQDVMLLEREWEAAALARSAEAYGANTDTLTSANQWSHAESNPFVAVDAAKEAVRTKIGRRPNTWVLPPTVLTALKNHPLVLNKLSTSSDRTPPTITQLQALFDIPQIVEADAIYDPGNGFADVWGKDAILAYVDPRIGSTPVDLRQRAVPNYGYTYELRGYPMVEQEYYNGDRRSWMYPTNHCDQPVLTRPEAGFLFKNAVA